MTAQLHIFAWALAISMSAVAVTTTAYAVSAVDGLARRLRTRRTDVDPALARPISAELRQAIAEREGSRG